MKKGLKVGVIGAGFIGPAHIEGIRRRGIEVSAIAEINQDQADRVAEQLSIPNAYGDWKEMIKDPTLDVIHITSPNYLHYEQAKACLEAGKHVICEKPLAMDTAQSSDLVALAKKKGLVNAVNFNLRFYPLVQEVRAQIQNNALGEKLYIIQGSYLQDWLLYDTDWNWRLEPEIGGDMRAVADIGSHWIDMVTYITGSKVSEVLADFETFLPVRKKPKKELETFTGKLETATEYEEQPIHTEDYAGILLKFSNGARGVLTVAQVCSGRKNRLFFEINGSESSLMWDSETPNELQVGHRSKPNQLIIKDPSLLSEQARWSASYPGGHAEGYPDTFKQLQTVVYESILAGSDREEPRYPTFQAGHDILAVGEAILASTRTGQWTKVDY